MTEIPPALAMAVIYGVIGATLANLAAIYIFHVTDPATMEDIETAILEDTLQAEAMKQAQANIERQAQQLGAILAARATGKLKYRLALPMAENESTEVINAKAADLTPQPGILESWMKAAAAKVKETIAPKPAMQIYQQTAPAPEVIENSEVQDNSVFTNGKAAE